MGNPTRVKRFPDTNWWWLSVLKNASTTMEKMTVEQHPEEGAYFLTIIRNPYDRLVSCWESKKEYFPLNCPKSFEDFIYHCVRTPDHMINPHAKSQSAFIDRDIDLYVDFDYLNRDLANIGIEVKTHHNKSDRKPWIEYYDTHTAKQVQDRYEKDFELYEQLLIRG